MGAWNNGHKKAQKAQEYGDRRRGGGGFVSCRRK